MKILFILSIIVTIFITIFLSYIVKNKFSFNNKKTYIIMNLTFSISFWYLILNAIFLANISILLMIFYILLVITIFLTNYFALTNFFGNSHEMISLMILAIVFEIGLLLFSDFKLNDPSIVTEEITLHQIENNCKDQVVTIELNEFNGNTKIYTVMQYDNDLYTLPLNILVDNVDSYEVIDKGTEKIVKNIKTKETYCLLSYFKFLKPIRQKEITYTVYVKEENLRYR